MLAHKTGELITSEFIAKSVTTNPVVIRRVLGDLRKAGLVESHSGNRGGWRLSKSAEQITIKDAYLAVREGSLFGLPPQNPNPHCQIGARIGAVVNKLFGESEASLLEYFQTATIASLFREIEFTQDTAEGESCPKRQKP